MGPIPHHMHQNDKQAALVGQEGKPESYYFPPQLNAIGNNFPYTFFGLEPGTTKQDIVRCLERWNEGDNGILNYRRLSAAAGHRLARAPLRAARARLAWSPTSRNGASDVFGMYQSLVEGRAVPRSLLIKDLPKEKHDDSIPGRRARLGRRTSIRASRINHYLEPIPVAGHRERGLRRSLDRLRQVRRQATLHGQGADGQPRRQCTIKDGGAYGWITVQGEGTIGKLRLQTPAMIRFGELTEDESS